MVGYSSPKAFFPACKVLGAGNVTIYPVQLTLLSISFSGRLQEGNSVMVMGYLICCGLHFKAGKGLLRIFKEDALRA